MGCFGLTDMCWSVKDVCMRFRRDLPLIVKGRANAELLDQVCSGWDVPSAGLSGAAASGVTKNFWSVHGRCFGNVSSIWNVVSLCYDTGVSTLSLHLAKQGFGGQALQTMSFGCFRAALWHW